jgi:hypothetical protein
VLQWSNSMEANKTTLPHLNAKPPTKIWQ